MRICVCVCVSSILKRIVHGNKFIAETLSSARQIFRINLRRYTNVLRSFPDLIAVYLTEPNFYFLCLFQIQLNILYSPSHQYICSLLLPCVLYAISYLEQMGTKLRREKAISDNSLQTKKCIYIYYTKYSHNQIK